jgi:hypothetical protein
VRQRLAQDCSATSGPFRLETTMMNESGSFTRGDAAILRFLQALETIEGDPWRQYAPGCNNSTATCPSKRRVQAFEPGLFFFAIRAAGEDGASRLSYAEFRLIPLRRPWDSSFPLRPSRAA